MKLQVLNSKKYVHNYLAQTTPGFVVRYGFLNVDRTFIVKFCWSEACKSAKNVQNLYLKLGI